MKIYISILERNFFLNLAEYVDELFRLTRFLRIGEHSPSWLPLPASKRKRRGCTKRLLYSRTEKADRVSFSVTGWLILVL